jgi:hypothetical protein
MAQIYQVIFSTTEVPIQASTWINIPSNYKDRQYTNPFLTGNGIHVPHHYYKWAGIAQLHSSGLQAEWSGVRLLAGLGIFLFTIVSRPALKPTQPPIQWVLGALSLGIKRPGREADHSPPSSDEVKECVEVYLHSPNTPSRPCAQLKQGDNFIFYPYHWLQRGYTNGEQ